MKFPNVETMSWSELRAHIISTHGWPANYIDHGKWIDWRETAKGTRALTHQELLAKHAGDELLGSKFKAYQPHWHE